MSAAMPGDTTHPELAALTQGYQSAGLEDVADKRAIGGSNGSPLTADV
jgi:hypothetical protein